MFYQDIHIHVLTFLSLNFNKFCLEISYAHVTKGWIDLIQITIIVTKNNKPPPIPKNKLHTKSLATSIDSNVIFPYKVYMQTVARTSAWTCSHAHTHFKTDFHINLLIESNIN